MTLKEIDAGLPNGFHDAEIRSFAVDYEKRKLTINLSVWLGNESDPGAHRLAEVVIEDLWFTTLDSSDTTYVQHDQCPTLDCAEDSGDWTIPALERLPKGFFASRMYVWEWCSMIYVAGRTASLVWKGEVYERWPEP